MLGGSDVQVPAITKARELGLYVITCGNRLQDAGHRYVARVYRPWVTSSRLSDVQAVRRKLARGGVPCAQPVETRAFGLRAFTAA